MRLLNNNKSYCNREKRLNKNILKYQKTDTNKMNLCLINMLLDLETTLNLFKEFLRKVIVSKLNKTKKIQMVNTFLVGSQLMISLIVYITSCGNQSQMESILI
jgi:hypothetical protein